MMNWYVWWGIAVMIFLASIVDAFVLSKLRYKRKRLLTPNKMLILGTFVSATLLLCPIYLEKFSDSIGWVEWGKSILLSMQHAIRLFAFEGDFMEFFDVETVTSLAPQVQMLYTGASAVLYVFAPLLTFSLILSFFQNVSAYRRYVFAFWKHTHVFSELNEKSLALAKSIDEKSNKRGHGKHRRYRIFRKALIVFTDVMKKDDEETLELIEEAKEMGAILFTKDLASVKYRNRYLSFRKLNFYLISDDEEEKIRHAGAIMRDYDISSRIELCVFSDDVRSELLLAAKNVKQMKVMRVNDIQSLVYHNLDLHGMRLFEHARETGPSEKLISAVIIGLGKYGLEMMKALTWFCQLPGYRIKINAFDLDKQAEKKFTTMCPELMSKDFNGQNIPGETRYEIAIHSGVDTNTPAFFEMLSQIKDATYIFVCLGDDAVNLSTAVRIRSVCESIPYVGDGRKPDIETVIYDSNIRNTMGVKWSADPDEENPAGLTLKKQTYDIHMIGDLEHFYSFDTVIDSDLITDGKNVHLRWGAESEFWKYEYNYRSSIAKAIHERLRVKMKLDIPGIHKEWSERTDAEKLAIGTVEHVRWNAYMRTEGYRYSGSQDRSSRNDLGKLHNNLVSVLKLSDDDLRKDA